MGNPYGKRIAPARARARAPGPSPYPTGRTPTRGRANVRVRVPDLAIGHLGIFLSLHITHPPTPTYIIPISHPPIIQPHPRSMNAWRSI